MDCAEVTLWLIVQPSFFKKVPYYNV